MQSAPITATWTTTQLSSPTRSLTHFWNPTSHFFKLLLHAPLHCVILHAGYTFISCLCYLILCWISVLFCLNFGLGVVDCYSFSKSMKNCSNQQPLDQSLNNKATSHKTPALPLTWDNHMYTSPQHRLIPKLTHSSHHVTTTPQRPHEIPEKTMCYDTVQWQHTSTVNSGPNVRHTTVSVLNIVPAPRWL